jgi:four helix bundle protein
MSYYNLEGLEVYQLAEAVGDEILFIINKWDYFARDRVGKQIAGLADSISANIAEGYGRHHYKENRNFCYFSRSSIIETKDWLKKSKTRGLINDEHFNLLYEKLQTIHLKLNAYLKFVGKSNTKKD